MDDLPPVQNGQKKKNRREQRQDKNICNRYIMLIQANTPHGQQAKDADWCSNQEYFAFGGFNGIVRWFSAVQNLVAIHIIKNVNSL